MNGERYFTAEKPLLTVMVQGETPERVKELMSASLPEGAEAFGVQFEKLGEQYKSDEIIRDIFSSAGDKPIYLTNYRHSANDGKSDDMLGDELVHYAELGADLLDVMGDYYDITPGELTRSPEAIEKQKALIERIHKKGKKVLMSSHVMKFTPAEGVLEIAKAHEARGADICKIVTGADCVEEELENLKIAALLKKELGIPFLFLCVGNCRILRRIGGLLGCCTYLCVHEYDALATPAQPLLTDLKIIRDRFLNAK